MYIQCIKPFCEEYILQRVILSDFILFLAFSIHYLTVRLSPCAPPRRVGACLILCFPLPSAVALSRQIGRSPLTTLTVWGEVGVT